MLRIPHDLDFLVSVDVLQVEIDSNAGQLLELAVGQGAALMQFVEHIGELSGSDLSHVVAGGHLTQNGREPGGKRGPLLRLIRRPQAARFNSVSPFSRRCAVGVTRQELANLHDIDSFRPPRNLT